MGNHVAAFYSVRRGTLSLVGFWDQLPQRVQQLTVLTFAFGFVLGALTGVILTKRFIRHSVRRACLSGVILLILAAISIWFAVGYVTQTEAAGVGQVAAVLVAGTLAGALNAAIVAVAALVGPPIPLRMTFPGRGRSGPRTQRFNPLSKLALTVKRSSRPGQSFRLPVEQRALRWSERSGLRPDEQPIVRSEGVLGLEEDQVDCTVFAPPSAAPGDVLFVQVFAHCPEHAGRTEELAREFDAGTQRRGYRSLEVPVSRGTRLAFDLAFPGLDLPEPRQELVWNGRPEAVQFEVSLPADCRTGAMVGTVTVSQDTVPIGHIKFKLQVTQRVDAVAQIGPVGDDVRHYRFAFVSYASTDRPKVVARVQMLRLAGIGFFQDVLDIDPGERWEKELYKKIDEADLFLLFWSNAARDSEWVRKEAQHAIARKGGDDFAPPDIKPVIIEGPPPPLPWPELSHLQFNDRLIYFMVEPAA